VYKVQKFVGVGSGRIGYAMTTDALSEVSNGAKWDPDPSFNVRYSCRPRICFSTESGFEGRLCIGPGAEGEREMTRCPLLRP
jgi:hypothetical protein